MATENNKNKRGLRFNEKWFYGIILLILGGLYLFGGSSSVNREMSWSEFKQAASQGAFVRYVVDREDKSVEAFLAPGKQDSIFSSDPGNKWLSSSKKTNYTVSCQLPSVDKFDEFYQDQSLKGEVSYTSSRYGFLGILLSFGPVLLFILFYFFLFRRMGSGGAGGGGGIFSVGKSKATVHDKSTMSVTFADVAGLQGAKEEVEELVHFLRNPQRYTQLGGKIPKGALLVGPPGTGKTLLAKAVAGEANVPFFSLSGSDFVEMFVGVGASRVRDLFAQAKEKAPCIIFIDEIDAVGRARGRNNSFGGNDERENTLNQLLTEMDGFGTNSGIIILAATNRADVLDSALLRAGRFDRQIYVDLPDINERKAIFLVHLKRIKTDSSLDVDLLARQTPGFSGADIANICNEAALIAARAEKDFVTKEDFMNAVDRVIGGLEKKNPITTAEERKSIAIHEAGHATVSWFLEFANPLVKVTIVPRGKALGAAWYLPEERQITTTQALLDQMCATLAGRAAEELFLGRISTGASNDLERVTRVAHAMVAYYGMSEKLPNLNYYDAQGDYNFQKPYSDKTAELIDEEVKEIIRQQYERAKAILSEHAAGHKELSDLLLSKEVIYTEDVERILGKRQWVSRTEEIMSTRSSEQSSSESQSTKEDATSKDKEREDETSPESEIGQEANQEIKEGESPE